MLDSRRRLWVSRYAVPLALTLAVIASSFGCGGGGGDNSPTPLAPVLDSIPSAWAGVWVTRTIVTVCNTSEALLDTTLTDTLCAGTSVANLLDLGDSTFCSDAVLRGDDRSVSYSCSESFVEEGCTGVFKIAVTTTIDAANNTSSTHGTLKLDFTPNSTSCPDLCLAITQSGNRVSGPPASCPSTLHSLRRAFESQALPHPGRR